MPWLLAGVVAVVGYFYGKSRGWWGNVVVCDVESDMPDNMKQQVLAQLAANKDPSSLMALATTLSGAGYVQSAYCCMHQAWVCNSKQGPEPQPPTPQQIAQAQAQRAVAQGLASPTGAAAAAGAFGGNPLAMDPTAVLQQLSNLAVVNVQPSGALPGSLPGGFSVGIPNEDVAGFPLGTAHEDVSGVTRKRDW